MLITETERLMLVKDKETICGATMGILRLANDSNNILEIKEKFQIILSLLNTIASYANPKNLDLNQFTEAVNVVFDVMTKEKELDEWDKSQFFIESLCSYANSVRFNFTTKEGLKITLPKINLNFGHVTNQ